MGIFKAIPLFLFAVFCVSGEGLSQPGPDISRPMDPMVHNPPSTSPGSFAAYGNLPLTFVENRGQTDPRVRYVSQGRGYTLFLTPGEVVLKLGDELRIRFEGAEPAPVIEPREKLPGTHSYFLGNDAAHRDNGASRGLSNIPGFAKVVYRGIYPGIDLVFYGNNGELEFDFIVAPGVDPNIIRLGFTGADSLSTDPDNNLAVGICGREIILRSPGIYQDHGAIRRVVQGTYVVGQNHLTAFQLGEYDKTRPLVIDPVLEYATYIGGSSIAALDEAFGIAADAGGNAYITGATQSLDFPTDAGAQNPTYPGGTIHAFVTKIDSAGSRLIYSTYIGGSNYDVGFAVAVDDNGNAYVGGKTLSTDFPVTPGVVQDTFGGGFVIAPPVSGTFDGFAAKLDPSGGTLVYATYLGGSDEDEISGIVVDGAGVAYVTGSTNSTNLPLSGQSVQAANAGKSDAFLALLDPFAQSIVWGSYLGGGGDDWGYAIAGDGARHVYITGQTRSTDFPTTAGAFGMTGNIVSGNDSDAFVLGIDLGGPPPAIGVPVVSYATYLGGSGIENQSFRAGGIDMDDAGNVYVTGNTGSDDFPTTASAFQGDRNGGSDAFVTKINPSGGTGADLVYSTYMGGTSGDQGMDIAVDAGGFAHVTGNTFSNDFPLRDPVQSLYGGTDTTFAGDAFVSALEPNGAGLSYSTFLGGFGGDKANGIAVDPGGNIHATGETRPIQGLSTGNFPTTSGAFQESFAGGLSDLFVARLSAIAPSITVDLKANDSDGPLTITEKDPLFLSLALDPSGNGADADYWILDFSPSGNWFHYDLSLGLRQGFEVTYQGPLVELNADRALTLSDLESGTHTLYFAVDLNMNGTVDTGPGLIFFDSVTVTVR